VPNEHFEPNDELIIAVAEKFGQLPDTVEREMTDYWFRRVVVQMDANILDRERKDKEDERKNRTK